MEIWALTLCVRWLCRKKPRREKRTCEFAEEVRRLRSDHLPSRFPNFLTTACHNSLHNCMRHDTLEVVLASLAHLLAV